MILDIINKKRLGQVLTEEEIKFFFVGYLNGDVKDYQMSSLLMAICINGMSEKETFALTDVFINSGDVLDFSNIDGVSVDKHSTGGVGDKTTLVIVPIVASLGVKVIKMSGRGLGFTGGTIDKLESIPGFKTDLSEEEIVNQVNSIGAVITGQTKDLCPLDKKIYALRDVTATTESIALIASSIMSKKIASGASKILIDIKVGSGAFIKNTKDANKLSEILIKIGDKYNRETRTIISNMDTPLGKTVGNKLEVLEALDVLSLKENGHFYDLCVELASTMISMAKGIDLEGAKELVLDSLKSGKALNKFREIVKEQHGNLELLKVNSAILELKAPYKSKIIKIDALKTASVAATLGAGRKSKEDSINYDVGVKLCKEVGDIVEKDELVVVIYKKYEDLTDYSFNDFIEMEEII